MKFTSEIVKSALSIYRKAKETGKATKENWRQYLSESYKQAFRYAKACIKNTVSFFKLAGDVIECRKVDFVSKFTDYPNFDKGRFFLWDCDNEKVITLHPWQLI